MAGAGVLFVKNVEGQDSKTCCSWSWRVCNMATVLAAARPDVLLDRRRFVSHLKYEDTRMSFPVALVKILRRSHSHICHTCHSAVRGSCRLYRGDWYVNPPFYHQSGKMKGCCAVSPGNRVTQS